MNSLVLSRKARLMMRYAANTFPNREVLGFGRCEVLDDGHVWVQDIIIPPHEVTQSNVDLKPEMLEQFMVELAKQHMTLSQWPLWWHSHGSMGVSPSSTDTDTLIKLAEEYGDVAFGLVTNAKEEYYGWYALHVKTNWGTFTSSGQLEVLVEQEDDEQLRAHVASMMQHVKLKQFQPPQPMLPPHNERGNKRKKRGSRVVVYEAETGKPVALPDGWTRQDYDFFRMMKEHDDGLTPEEQAMGVIEYGMKVIREGGPVLAPMNDTFDLDAWELT